MMQLQLRISSTLAVLFGVSVADDQLQPCPAELPKEHIAFVQRQASKLSTTSSASTPEEACNWQCYLDRYQDLQDAFGATNTAAAQTHYRDHGESEGRNCLCDEASTTCTDTPDWTNGYGHGCSRYAERYCEDNGPKPDQGWTLGSKYNYPEDNCCVCGSGTIAAFKKFETGACADHGREVIKSKATCDAAAAALGLWDTSASAGTWSNRPEGCYYKPGEAKQTRLQYNSGGAGQGSDSAREQICGPVKTSAPADAPADGEATGSAFGKWTITRTGGTHSEVTEFCGLSTDTFSAEATADSWHCQNTQDPPAKGWIIVNQDGERKARDWFCDNQLTPVIESTNFVADAACEGSCGQGGTIPHCGA